LAYTHGEVSPFGTFPARELDSMSLILKKCAAERSIY
jgi:hypothetical protein